MATPPVNGVSSTSALDYTRTAPVQQLNQKDFIQLLVAQMTTQDPLNPQKDTEFIGQMAQFSALQSSNTMQAELQNMHAHQLLGQTVQIKVDDAQTLVGKVTAVDSSGSEPKLIVGNDAYSLADVTRVEQTTTNYAPA